MEKKMLQPIEVGNKYGKNTVLEPVYHSNGKGAKPRTVWKCKCECGRIHTLRATQLRNPEKVTCICTSSMNIYPKYGDPNQRLYFVWHSMKDRCKTVSSYVKKHISVCDEWKNDYCEFRKLALENGYDFSAPKSKITIDRIDNSKGYSPENCRWVEPKVNANNRDTNRIVEYRGRCFTIAELAREVGMKREDLQRRIVTSGWSVEEAVEIPLSRKNSGRRKRG